MEDLRGGWFLPDAAVYATLANSTSLAATVDEGTDAACTEQSEGLVFFETNLPSFGSWDEWADTEMVSGKVWDESGRTPAERTRRTLTAFRKSPSASRLILTHFVSVYITVFCLMEHRNVCLMKETDAHSSLTNQCGTFANDRESPTSTIPWSFFLAGGWFRPDPAVYATLPNSTGLAATVDEGTDAACTEQFEGLVFFETNLPSFGSWDVWVDTEMVSGKV